MSGRHFLAGLSAIALVASSLGGCRNGEHDGKTPEDGGGGAGTGGRPHGGEAGSSAGGTVSQAVFDGSGIWAESPAELGVRGVFFILEDSVASGVAISDGLAHTDLVADFFGDESRAPFSSFTEETTEPCISGSLAIVTLGDGSPCDPVKYECAWDEIWGGGLGLHLNQKGGSGSAPEPWDATAYGVSGFEFTTTGDIGQATLRFKAKDSAHPDEDFCAMVAMGADRRVPLAKLKHQCWENQGTLSLDTTKLTELQWQLVPDAKVGHEITNFCVTRVAVF